MDEGTDDIQRDKKATYRQVIAYGAETVLVVLVLCFVCIAAFLLSVSVKPLDLKFAKPFIEKSLQHSGNGLHATADRLVLYWPSWSSPLLMSMQNARVLDKDDKNIIAVDEAVLGLATFPLFIGQIKPQALILNRPDLKLTRLKDGRVTLDFGGRQAIKPQLPEQEKLQTGIVQNIIAYILNPESTGSTSPLAHLEQFKITQANIMVEDRLNQAEWNIPAFDITFLHTRDGLKATFKSDTGQIFLPEFFQDALRFKNLILAASYDKQSQTLTLQNTQVTLYDDALLNLSGQIGLRPDGASGIIAADIPELSQEKLKSLWPKGLEDYAVTEWLTEKIHSGTYRDFHFETLINAEKKDGAWHTQFAKTKGRFNFSDTTIAYLQRLTPVTEASGSGIFEYETGHLVINAQAGKLGQQNVKSAKAELTNIVDDTNGPGHADISLDMSGPLGDLLAYIEQERINAGHGFDAARVRGTADYTVGLSLPTSADVTINDVAITMNGTIANGFLPDVVSGMDLSDISASAGIKDGVLNIKGKGALDGRSADITYERFLNSAGKSHAGKITAKLTGDLSLLQKLGADLSDFIKGGTFGADITYTEYAGGKASADVKADLTATQFAVDPFTYRKPAGSAASTDMTITLQDKNVTGVQSLNITAPDLKISGGVLGFQGNKLRRATLNNYAVYNNKGSMKLDFISTGEMGIDISGDYFDLTPFMSGSNAPQDKTARRISLNVSKLKTSPDAYIKNAKIDASLNTDGRFNRLSMDAVAGNGTVTLRYAPDAAGYRKFTLEALDAGNLLRAFDIYPNIRGGKLNIAAASSAPGERNMKGSAYLHDFRVANTPVLAKLLNVMSLPGLLKTLEGEGMTFSKMATDFAWISRPAGSVIHVENGRTSGNSLGLTFDGKLDNAAKTMDINGTLIPLSGVNKIIGDIPVVGDFLTGGTGSLIAVTYTVKGQQDNPDVFVNPLSALTPGLLRRILFEEK